MGSEMCIRDRISEGCGNKWGSNYEMVKYCIEKQRIAKRTIERIYASDSRTSGCEDKWGNNYEMILYCIQK